MAVPVINITDNAAFEIKRLLAARDKESVGIKVKVKSGGCSGLVYDIEYADDISKYDEIIKDKDVTVIIDPKAILYLVGTTLDFTKEKTREGFDFKNPNAKVSCGCGKSFNNG